MRLLVGLGNPGQEYRQTRHNAGFLVLDRIAAHLNAADWQSKHKGLLTSIDREGQKVLLLKPQTFMNRSGISVAETANFYKIPPEEICVFYDELDLPIGKLRVRQGGGAGGHNGIRSIDQHIGNAYWRVRMGIDHPGHKDRVHGYVLHPFSDDQWHITDKLYDSVAEYIGMILSHRPELFMSRIAEAMAGLVATGKEN